MEKVRELDQAGAFISYIYHIVQVSFPFTLSLIPGIKMKKIYRKSKLPSQDELSRKELCEGTPRCQQI